MSDPQTMEFDVEFDDRDPEGRGPWWAQTPVEGSSAIGDGINVWAAIGSCLEDVPEARERSRAGVQRYEQARAGTFLCPGCGALRPKLTEDMMQWAVYCATCRGEGDE